MGFAIDVVALRGADVVHAGPVTLPTRFVLNVLTLKAHKKCMNKDVNAFAKYFYYCAAVVD